MVWLLLAACRCPSFGEMQVYDPDDLAPDGFVDDVEAAISDFAVWTGREGVCVPGVEVRDEITFHGEDALGQYHGLRARITVVADTTDPYLVTVHELCHALDREEGLVAANPELFPPIEADASYNTLRLRTGEAFADACEVGPVGVALNAAVQEQCGGEPIDPVAAYLAEEVYREADLEVTAETGLHAATWSVLFPDGANVLAAAGVGGELMLLLQVGDGVGVSRIDRATWTATPPLFLGGDATGVVTLAASDEDVGIAIIGDRALRFDIGAGTVEALDGVHLPKISVSATWDQERLVVSGWGGDGTGRELRVWPDGTDVDLPHLARGLLPSEDAVTMLIGDEVTRWDGSTFTATSIPWPSQTGFARWPDGRVALAPYVGGSPVPLLYADGAVALPEDACSMWGGQTRFVADLGGEAAIVGAYEVEAGGSLPVTVLSGG